jgi:bacterioferritin-associated ferredoxin
MCDRTANRDNSEQSAHPTDEVTQQNSALVEENAATGKTLEHGAALRAGTNCGSCLPELRKIVDRGRLVQPV